MYGLTHACAKSQLDATLACPRCPAVANPPEVRPTQGFVTKFSDILWPRSTLLEGTCNIFRCALFREKTYKNTPSQYY